MTINVKLFNSEEFAAEAAKYLAACIHQKLHDSCRVSIALSGGSTPKNTYLQLAEMQNIPWKAVDFFQVDERFVSDNDERSNQKLIRETIINSTGARFFPVDTNVESATLSASKYHELLTSRGGKIDITLLGIGEDGHTASLFPGYKFFEEKDVTVISADHPSDGTIRISLTAKCLMNSERIFLVQGAQKKEILNKVLDRDTSLPASYFIDGSTILTDLKTKAF